MEPAALIGHQAVWQYLTHVYEAGRLGHAYLLSGPAHVGKATLAQQMVARLLCTEAAAGQPACDTCSACRQVASRAHPDLCWLEPLADKALVSIDQVRELISFTQLTALGGRWRAVVIENVAQLTAEAANALLKVLEEPPQGVVFWLLDHHEGTLLGTLRSRCVPLALGLVPQLELQTALERRGLAPAPAAEFARQSAGRPGLALSLLASEGALTRKYEVARRLLELFRPGSWPALQRWYESELAPLKGAGEAHLELPAVLAIWLEVARDLLLLRLGLSSAVRYQKLQGELQLVAAQQTIAGARERCRMIGLALAKLAQNANPRLTYEWLTVTLPRL